MTRQDVIDRLDLILEDVGPNNLGLERNILELIDWIQGDIEENPGVLVTKEMVIEYLMEYKNIHDDWSLKPKISDIPDDFVVEYLEGRRDRPKIYHVDMGGKTF